MTSAARNCANASTILACGIFTSALRAFSPATATPCRICTVSECATQPIAQSKAVNATLPQDTVRLFKGSYSGRMNCRLYPSSRPCSPSSFSNSPRQQAPLRVQVARPAWQPGRKRGRKRSWAWGTRQTTTQGAVSSTAQQNETVAGLFGLYPETQRVNAGFLRVSDLHTIYFEEYGNRKNGIPAVFLHGGPGAGCFPTHAYVPGMQLEASTTCTA